MILSSEGGQCGEWWYWYDRRFIQQLPPLELAEFGKLDQPLYSTALAMASAGGSAPPWSRWRRQTGQVRPEQRGESSRRVLPGMMQSHVWRLHADLLMLAPDVEESIERGCAIRPSRHRTLPRVEDRDMHEELHHLTLMMRILYSHPI